jgi:hypothetical protein
MGLWFVVENGEILNTVIVVHLTWAPAGAKLPTDVPTIHHYQNFWEWLKVAIDESSLWCSEEDMPKLKVSLVPPNKRMQRPTDIRVDHEWTVRRLRSALRALAAPGSEALASLPEGTVKADELALEYDDCLRVYSDNFPDEISQARREALLVVADAMESMSGPDRPELWTEDAVVHHEDWNAVRVAARNALAVLDRND